MDNVPEKFAWLKVGTRCDYHSTIGGPVTQPGLTVRDEPFPIPAPRGYRMKPSWCVMLNGKSGWVACESLSPSPTPETP
jgi:hypothetical protein